MRIFRSTDEVKAACLPRWQAAAVAEAVSTMEGIFGQGFDSGHGYVVLFEPADTPEDTVPLLGCHMGAKLESTRRRHGCLIGLTLWGNSGDGVTWICPETPGYAPKVQEVLRNEL